MKLTINVSDLLRGLRAVKGSVPRRSTIPILSNVRLDATRDGLRITGTDLDLQITVTVPAEVSATGETTVPAETLLAFVGKLGAGAQALMEMDGEKQRVAVKSGRSRCALNVLGAADFPDFDCGELSHNFTLTGRQLEELFQRTSFAISTEETRFYLTGVFLHPLGKQLAGVATDGHRLAKATIDLPAGTEGMPGVIVPRKTVAEVMRLADGADSVAIGLSAGKIRFQVGDAVLASKLIDGTFPDYARVIPEANDKAATADRKALTAAADRVATISTERGRAVKLSFTEGLLTLSVTNADVGNATEEAEVEYSAAPIDVGFNSKYLHEVIAACRGETVTLKMADPGSPTVFCGKNDDGFLAVCMPMRVS